MLLLELNDIVQLVLAVLKLEEGGVSWFEFCNAKDLIYHLVREKDRNFLVYWF